ncbi:MAG: Holliday junction branch migration protein RuvA [Cytophagales bacterium]|nr:Holliday junction branch migration protein RuvA [Bernardetiaceae bacterium]MDW8203974.1 Holliday junction branch migration protein RuvA [Cytophagales bacterium]
MYAYITGKIVHRAPAVVVVDNHGIGYELRISLQTYSQLQEGETCRLFTYMHINSNDLSQTLYGFASEDEKSLFLLLISVSGVGAGIALNILSSLSAQEIREAIAREDLRTLQNIKGIGSKTAQRLILELKDKVRKEEAIAMAEKTTFATAIHSQLHAEAVAALTIMGVPKPAAEKSIAAVLKKHGSDLSLEELIRQALKTGV